MLLGATRQLVNQYRPRVLFFDSLFFTVVFCFPLHWWSIHNKARKGCIGEGGAGGGGGGQDNQS